MTIIVIFVQGMIITVPYHCHYHCHDDQVRGAGLSWLFQVLQNCHIEITASIRLNRKTEEISRTVMRMRMMMITSLEDNSGKVNMHGDKDKHDIWYTRKFDFLF